ncbi:hypothetical protein ANCDUO_25002, partial [Ancylostoma duodenale]
TTSLQEPMKVEAIQEKIQASLDEYCRTQKAHQPCRFGRILLRLPALRTLSSSTVESLFFSKLDTPVNMLIKDLLSQSVATSTPVFPAEGVRARNVRVIEIASHWSIGWSSQW